MADSARGQNIYANSTLPIRPINGPKNGVYNTYGSTKFPASQTATYDVPTKNHFGTLPAKRVTKNLKNYSTQSLHRPPKTKTGQQKIVEWLAKRKPSPKKPVTVKEKYLTGSLPRDFNLSKSTGYYGRKYNIYTNSKAKSEAEEKAEQSAGLSRYMDLTDEDFYEVSTEPTASSRRTLTRYDIYGNVVQAPEDYYKSLGYSYTYENGQEILGVPVPPVDYTDSDGTFSSSSSSEVEEEEELVEDPTPQPHRVRFRSPPELVQMHPIKTEDDTILYEGSRNTMSRLYSKIKPTVQNFIAKKIKVDEKELKKKVEKSDKPEKPPKPAKRSSLEISMPILPRKRIEPTLEDSEPESSGSSGVSMSNKHMPPKPPPRPRKEVFNMSRENSTLSQGDLEETLPENAYGMARIPTPKIPEVAPDYENFDPPESPKEVEILIEETPTHVGPKTDSIRTTTFPVDINKAPSQVPRKDRFAFDHENIYQNSDIRETLGLNSEPKVCYLGDIRIDFMCEYTDDNVIIHFTSTESIPSKNGDKNEKILRRGAITEKRANMEYGPGIVQKLREKFSKMATVAVKEAQLSPHSRRKRYPSTDDFLTDGEKVQSELRQKNLMDSYTKKPSSNGSNSGQNSPIPQQPQQENRVSRIEQPSRASSEAHSYLIEAKRTARSHDAGWVPRPRPVAFYGQQESTIDRTTIEPISQLRAKFDRESMVDRPRQIMFPPTHRSRSVSITSPEQRVSVPEFIEVGQKLKKSTSREQVSTISTLNRAKTPVLEYQSSAPETITSYSTLTRPGDLARDHREIVPIPMSQANTIYVHRHREESAPPRIFAEEIPEISPTPVKDAKEHEQRTKQNGTPLPAKYFGGQNMVRQSSDYRDYRRPHSLPRENSDGPRPVRVLDLLSPPADPEPKGQHQFFGTATPDRMVVQNSRNISPPLSTASSDRSPPPEEPIQHHRTQTNDRSDNDSIVSQDDLHTNFEPHLDTRMTSNTPTMTEFYGMSKKPPMTLPVGRYAQQQQQANKTFIRTGGPGSTPVTNAPKISVISDTSGIEEMQRLLNKFNAKRESKILEESTKISPTVEPKIEPLPPPLPPKTTFTSSAPPPLPSKAPPPKASTISTAVSTAFTNSISYEPRTRSPFGSNVTSPIPVAAVPPMTLSISVGESEEKKTMNEGVKRSDETTTSTSGPIGSSGVASSEGLLGSQTNMASMKRPAPPPPNTDGQNYSSGGLPLPPRAPTDVKPVPAPLTTLPPAESTTNGSRKSISTKFLESKRQQLQQTPEETDLNMDLAYDKKELQLGPMGKSEKPYGDDVIVSTDDEIPFSPTRAKHFEELIKQVHNPPPEQPLDFGQNATLDATEKSEDDGGIRLISQKSTTAFDESDPFSVFKQTPPISRSDFLRNVHHTEQDSDSELEDGDHDTYSFNDRISVREVSMLASDGNPVRHSLLNLVCEEDIPELLEAMAEECHFVFEDYTSNMASTSSIIHAPAKRSERRKQRNVNRIAFVNEPPKVFAYLDENSALEDGEWSEGCPISYEDYQKIVNGSQEAQAQQMAELSKWRQAMEQKYADIEEVATNGVTPPPTATNTTPTTRSTSPNDSSLGVTSRFSYGNVPNQCSQPIQIRATGDCGTSAI